MDYIVWIKPQYATEWAKKPCGDLEAVQREILSAAGPEVEIILTEEIPFTLGVVMGAGPGPEAPKTKTRPEPKAGKKEEKPVENGKPGPQDGQDPGGESPGKV